MIIDGTILTVIPPLVAAVLTYIVANKRARVQNAKLIADIQTQAVEQVRLVEEKMRAEIWVELEKVRKENAELRKEMESQRSEIMDLKKQLEAASSLRITLTEQVHSLERLVETYKTRIIELEKKDK
jgi:predicted nuclease with TOPRIM domain